jgi:hypothetical protein
LGAEVGAISISHLEHVYKIHILSYQKMELKQWLKNKLLESFYQQLNLF